MIKRKRTVVGLFFLCCLMFSASSVGAEPKEPEWNGAARLGQWMGDKIREGSHQMNKFLSDSEDTKPLSSSVPPKPSNGSNGDKMIDQLIPRRVEVLHQKYPISHYQLDFVLQEVKFWNVGDQIESLFASTIHEVNNLIWILNVLGSRCAAWFLSSSLELDLAKEMGDSLSEGLRRFAGFHGTLNGNGLYGLLFPLMILFAGFWIGWRAIITEDEVGATRGLISMVAVILFSFAFFHSAKSIVASANQASTGITKEILALSTNLISSSEKTRTADESSAEATNNLWNILIHKPYVLLQFGSAHVSPKRVDELLRLPILSEERAKQTMIEVKRYGNTQITASNNGYRFIFLLFVSLMNLMIGVVVIFFACAMIGYQLYFLMMIVLAPIALVWAIVPTMQENLYLWATKTLSALLMKIAWGVLLTVYFSFSTALYDFSEDKNYLSMMLLQLVLIILLFWKRKEIFQVVTSPARLLSKGGLGETWQDDSSNRLISQVAQYHLLRKLRFRMGNQTHNKARR